MDTSIFDNSCGFSNDHIHYQTNTIQQYTFRFLNHYTHSTFIYNCCSFIYYSYTESYPDSESFAHSPISSLHHQHLRGIFTTGMRRESSGRTSRQLVMSGVDQLTQKRSYHNPRLLNDSIKKQICSWQNAFTMSVGSNRMQTLQKLGRRKLYVSMTTWHNLHGPVTVVNFWYKYALQNMQSWIEINMTKRWIQR